MMAQTKYIAMPCEVCGLPTLPWHHKFRKDKHTRRLYPEYIDHPDNKQYACLSCNSSHQAQGRGLIIWHEKDFCKHFGIESRSKSGKL